MMTMYISNESPKSPSMFIYNYIGFLYMVPFILVTLMILIYASLIPMGQSGGGTYDMIPFQNPFKDSFFHQHVEGYKVIGDLLHRDVMSGLINISAYNDTKSSVQSLKQLNDYKTDFLILPEYSIAPYFSPTKYPNVRFISTLYSQVITIIAPDNTGIRDLGDIAHFSCKVKIAIQGKPNNDAHQCLLDILARYSTSVMDNIEFRFLSDKELIEQYDHKYHLYFSVVMHPNPVVGEILGSVPSHLVSMNSVNGGSYFVENHEKAFYKKLPHYGKMMMEETILSKYYPMLSNSVGRSLYMPSIKSHFVLLTHDKVTDTDIAIILKKLLIQLHTNKVFKGLTAVDVSHTNILIPRHVGTVEIYKKLHQRSDDNYYGKG